MESSINIEPEQDKPHDLSMKTNHDNPRILGSNPSVVSHKNLVSNISSNVASTNSIQNQNNQRKVKHIPPPLDLNAHTLEPDHVQGGVLGGGSNHDPSVRVPKSPNELPRESLPLRKR